MTSERDIRWRRALDELFSRQDYIKLCVDAAVAPLRRYLNSSQTGLVRTIVEANIQVDPVSRRLLANALSMHFRSHRRKLRAGGPKAKLKNIPKRSLASKK